MNSGLKKLKSTVPRASWCLTARRLVIVDLRAPRSLHSCAQLLSTCGFSRSEELCASQIVPRSPLKPHSRSFALLHPSARSLRLRAIDCGISVISRSYRTLTWLRAWPRTASRQTLGGHALPQRHVPSSVCHKGRKKCRSNFWLSFTAKNVWLAMGIT